MRSLALILRLALLLGMTSVLLGAYSMLPMIGLRTSNPDHLFPCPLAWVAVLAYGLAMVHSLAYCAIGNLLPMPGLWRRWNWAPFVLLATLTGAIFAKGAWELAGIGTPARPPSCFASHLFGLFSLRAFSPIPTAGSIKCPLCQLSLHRCAFSSFPPAPGLSYLAP